MDGILQVGFARTNITPPLTIPYLGFDPRHAFFEGVHDPLYARALAVGDGTTDAVLVVADAIGLSNGLLGSDRSLTAEVRMRVERACGMPAAHVMLACTHAHSTPETLDFRPLATHPGASAWLEVLLDQLASSAALAMRQRAPHRLKAGSSILLGLSRNRRVPPGVPVPNGIAKPVQLGANDPELRVLLFEPVTGDGGPIVVSNFACHPVTVQVQPLVSADFPGLAMALVEKAIPGCRGSLFIQGACGNLNPVRGHTGSFEDVQRYALMLAGEIIKTVGQLSAPDNPAANAPVGITFRTIALPGRELPGPGPLLAAQAGLRTRLAETATEDERRQLRAQIGRTEEALRQIELVRPSIPAEVQAMRIGDVALVGLPGEPFVELGVEIKRRSAAPHTIVSGYANGYLGYFAPPAAWELGGYEVGNGPWAQTGPQAAGQLVETALVTIQELWTAAS